MVELKIIQLFSDPLKNGIMNLMILGNTYGLMLGMVAMGV